MDILAKLNPQQHRAVTASAGPTLVLAGPGSGKTRVLTHRIAYLVGQMGVEPRCIMAVTFTNKAAKEMKHRVEDLLEGQLRGLTIGTFHSICARFLRREAQHLPVTADFVIFDTSDQEALVKQIVRDLNLNDKQYSPGKLLSKISSAKNELIGPEEFAASTYFNEIVKRVYTRYQQALTANNALDFDDLLTGVVQLFNDHPEVLAKYQRYYEHILVDEFQDTNTAQYALLRQLAARSRNLYCVGDPDQCFPSDTPILTPSGYKPIETLQVGEEVIAASGRGSTLPARVAHVGQRPFSGELVKVTTRSGHTFRATPNHITFARLGVKPGLHYVYLMYRADKGYRIGIASHARSDGVSDELQTGLRVRSNQENAHRLWILKVCADRNEAHYWEAYYAFQYGLPTTVFHVRGRRMRMTQALIDRLFAAIDTPANARRLLADLQMDARYPHFVPQGTFRNIINLRYFGDGRVTEQTPWHAHRVDLWSSEPVLAGQLRTSGYNPRLRQRNNWRIGVNRIHYDDIHAEAQKLSRAADDAEIVTGAFLVEKGSAPLAPRFSLMPASHLHPTMILAVEQDGRIIEDEIVAVSREPYHGPVYDFEVEELHNYLAGGIAVHNSVYRWRGADYRNVRKLQDDYPDALTILLEQNYRSTQTILDAAMAVIDQHPGRTRKQLFTERGAGVKVFAYEAYNEQEEAQWVVNTILELAAQKLARPGDCAVMYRTNAQSRAVEEAFIRAGVPHRLVGAQRFYGRKEVKDLLAYLRLIHNPADSVSLLRVINTPPRGIGAKTLEQLQTMANDSALTLSDLLRDLGDAGAKSRFAAPLGAKAATALVNFGAMLNHWHSAKSELSIVQLMDTVLARINYKEFIDDGSEEGEQRWENVLELRGVAAEADEMSLAEFLEQVALVSDQDTLAEEGKAATLLTLHAAKGLEFPVVFIVGLDEGVLPHQRSFDDPEAMHEERRLMYVGLTRAKDRLYLLRAFRRSLYGDSSLGEVSRFLADIPSKLLSGNITHKQMRAEAFYKKATTWDGGTAPRAATGKAYVWGESESKPKAKPVAPQATHATGQRVRHPHFGEGIVIETKFVGGEEEIIIAFDDVGLKRLALSVARLEVLKG